jgi:DNA-binding transcriptional MerR regulator
MKHLLMTVADVARELNRTPAAVRASANAGHLPVAMKTASGMRLFDPTAVQEFKARRDARAAQAA